MKKNTISILLFLAIFCCLVTLYSMKKNSFLNEENNLISENDNLSLQQKIQNKREIDKNSSHQKTSSRILNSQNKSFNQFYNKISNSLLNVARKESDIVDSYELFKEKALLTAKNYNFTDLPEDLVEVMFVSVRRQIEEETEIYE